MLRIQLSVTLGEGHASVATFARYKAERARLRSLRVVAPLVRELAELATQAEENCRWRESSAINHRKQATKEAKTGQTRIYCTNCTKTHAGGAKECRAPKTQVKKLRVTKRGRSLSEEPTRHERRHRNYSEEPARQERHHRNYNEERPRQEHQRKFNPRLQVKRVTKKRPRQDVHFNNDTLFHDEESESTEEEEQPFYQGNGKDEQDRYSRRDHRRS